MPDADLADYAATRREGRRVVVALTGSEPVEADDRTGHQHKREEPPPSPGPTAPAAAASNSATTALAHPLQARALVEHAKQLYAGSVKLETLAAVEALAVLR